MEQRCIEWKGIVLMQGEADAGALGTAVEWAGNLFKFIEQITKLVRSRTPLPVVIGRIMGGKYSVDKEHGALKIVRDQQRSLGETLPLWKWVDTDDLNTSTTVQYHFTTDGMIELGRRFGSAMLSIIRESSAQTPANSTDSNEVVARVPNASNPAHLLNSEGDVVWA